MIYEPAEDSYLLAQEVKKYARGKIVLDMGAGSGIQSKAALDSGAKGVLSVECDPESLRHLKQQGLTALSSDLFSNVQGSFDLIIFNPPYLPEDKQEDDVSRKITTGGKKGDEIILRFLKDVQKHLAKKGTILLLLSSLTPKKRIQTLLTKLHLKSRTLITLPLFMEELEVLEITNQSFKMD